MAKSRSVLYRRISLVGRRVLVRPYKYSDFKTLVISQKSRLPSTNRFDEPVRTIKEMDYEKFKESVKRHRTDAKEGRHYIFGVFAKKTGEFLGQIDFFTINKQLRWANIGYQIQNQYFGRGYASEAGRLGLKMAFQHLDYHRVEAGTELDNKASQKVALKIGLRAEGIRKKFFADHGGIDMRIYGTNAIDFVKRPVVVRKSNRK